MKLHDKRRLLYRIEEQKNRNARIGSVLLLLFSLIVFIIIAITAVELFTDYMAKNVAWLYWTGALNFALVIVFLIRGAVLESKRLKIQRRRADH